MKSELLKLVETHSGTFRCRPRRRDVPTAEKHVKFEHEIEAHEDHSRRIPSGSLTEFYSTVSSIRFYLDQTSGDSAVYLANPAEWDGLYGGMRGWIGILSASEKSELVPEWFWNSIVIGEFPRTGDYLIVECHGTKSGAVYAFFHDGFEFQKLAPDIWSFVESVVAPTKEFCSAMTSSMLFCEKEDYSDQWYVIEMTDNRGLQYDFEDY